MLGLGSPTALQRIDKVTPARTLTLAPIRILAGTFIFRTAIDCLEESIFGPNGSGKMVKDTQITDLVNEREIKE